MTRFTTDEEIDDVDATAKVTDGRVSMCAQISSELLVQAPDTMPLSANEPHLTLRVADDDVCVTVDLDGEALDELGDAIHTVQRELRQEDTDR